MATINSEALVRSDFWERLAKVQKNLKAPKGQYNSFGGYPFRSCEDILAAVKPLCNQNKLCIMLSDDMIHIEGHWYVKATVTVKDILSESMTSCSAFAREMISKKGSDESQLTGLASSYARKSALSGMFLVDNSQCFDAPEPLPELPTAPEPIICPQCGKPVKPYKKGDGTIITADEIIKNCSGVCLKCYTAKNKKAVEKK